ncbi:MAG: putative glycolate oxidase, GlcD subunit [Myxococcaceae bacterium]|nr:putative glycolate oxidase, GlcD subunit [Myxococcaceae bacterium]
MKRPDPAAVAAVRAELEAKLGAGQVSADPDQLEVYGHDESDMGDFAPQLIAFARSTADVQQVFRTAFAHQVPVTPVAARSGKSGGSLPLYGGVSLSLERMNRIVSISPEDLTAVVEPGVITGALMKAAEELGLFYPPDPNSWEFCSIGGNIAENAGGPRALKYGVTRDYVLGMQWVLPTGEALRIGKRTIKGVAGYDLCGLFVGSEGTLGVATEITLQLIPRPRKVMTALVIFKDVLEAARAVSAMLASGLLPRCLELLDDVSIRAIDGRGFSFPPGAGAAVIAEVDGNHDDALLLELEQLSQIAAAHGAIDTLLAQDDAQREKLWAARRVVSTALRALKPFKISEDIAVPRSKIPEAIAGFKALGARLGLTVATYGHAGDGNLHANILFDGPHQRPQVDEALAQMMRITVELGGTITGEHGVGYAKRAFLSLEQEPGLIAFQQRLKTFIDPLGLLNPGKIFESDG